MFYVPSYSEVEEEIVSVTLNLSNVAEIKNKVDDIDVDKINSIDELQGKNC